MTYKRIRVTHALSKSGLPDLDYSFNPYAGCAHACIYCYARAFTRYEEVSRNWGRIVYIKENIIDVLRDEIVSLKKGVVGVSTITDPYQPIESVEKLTRLGVELLLRSGFKVSIQTKSPLVTRDLDILERYRGQVNVGFTITTLNPKIASLIEPNSPSPLARAEALKRVSSRGLDTWVFLGPIIRGVNDTRSSLEQVIDLAFETGSKLFYDFYHHRPELAESMKPLLVENPLATGAPRIWRERVQEVIRALCDERGIECIPEFQAQPVERKIDDFLG
ncbi:radical SAM protein [Infirmifilum uzonense]|uniref:Radical SAM protein n=1 Tax=Infirmifilum uzonense TaxID=1550241 RepID=A0A0F7FHC0_9CREN|nr:radical SAM protein [Infirmifilum uzonense]